MCLKELGYKAKSFTGWQIPIITDNVYTNARIKYINTEKIKKELENNNIVVIAGFQGITEQGDITTLGRGGSDTTAVAIAAAIKADRCDIYTDIDGIYSSDPKIIKNVVKIESITYEEMLEFSSTGAKVLHSRCIEIAKEFDLPLTVKSSFETDSQGTIIRKDCIENSDIAGLAKYDNISKIDIIAIENNNIYKLFNILATNNIIIDNITYNYDEFPKTTLSFSIKKESLNDLILLLEKNKEDLQIEKLEHTEELSKISIIGIGINNNPNITSKIFNTLYTNNIKVYSISTSETKISILVDKNLADMALNKLHYDLIENK